MKNTIVVDIEGSLQISEDLFVKSSGPGGQFSNFLMGCFTYILNRDWKETKKLAKVLSYCAMEELSNRNGRRGYLQRELSPDDLKHNKIIFIPVLHKDHWTLLVVQHKKKHPSITFLDSLNSEKPSKYHIGLVRFFSA
ncbi:hypothetical protein BDA96_08G144800 [Sorghum bicolor]|uniref:Ubiquitin-like protease family profile domain-containing protein n=2 Tax=Sorghum bicolor TaxID=4558 RepID=A0A921QG58_SORBI|nr:hypothetical protein BDA96_08G144800 [Sorghum bicolor]OQU79327.1 hypothetical protein SORBI_3008G131651 [Sorghum bicolor]